MHPSNHRPSLSPPPKMATEPWLEAASGVHTATAVWPARPLGNRLSDTFRHVHVAAMTAIRQARHTARQPGAQLHGLPQ